MKHLLIALVMTLSLPAVAAAEHGCLCQTYVCAETTRPNESRLRLFCRFLPMNGTKGVLSLWEERHPAADAKEFDCENTRSFGNLCDKYARSAPHCVGRYRKLPTKTVGPVASCLAPTK